MLIAILFSKVMGKRKTKIQLKFQFQCSRKTENENTRWNSIFYVVGKRKTENENGISNSVFLEAWVDEKRKVQVRIPFSHVVGKRLALRYTHYFRFRFPTTLKLEFQLYFRFSFSHYFGKQNCNYHFRLLISRFRKTSTV